MLPGMAADADRLACPQGLAAIGGYLRSAGRSLGLTIDTPRLDTQLPFETQIDAIDEGLVAATRLAQWWNRDGRRTF